VGKIKKKRKKWPLKHSEKGKIADEQTVFVTCFALDSTMEKGVPLVT